MNLFSFFKRKPQFEYGTIRDTQPARRNRKTGEVEMLLWKAGEHGHTEDYYHKCGAGWETTFKCASPE